MSPGASPVPTFAGPGRSSSTGGAGTGEQQGCHSGPQGCWRPPAPSCSGNLLDSIGKALQTGNTLALELSATSSQLQAITTPFQFSIEQIIKAPAFSSSFSLISAFCLSFMCYLCTISPFLYQQVTTWFSHTGQNVYPHGHGIKQLKTPSIPILNQGISPACPSWSKSFKYVPS